MRDKIKPLLFVFGLTMLYAFTFILIDFIDTPISNVTDFLAISAKWGFIVAATFILLCFITINKYVFSVLFPLLTVCCTALAYYRVVMHVQLTQMVLDLAVVNDFRTSWEAISWQLIILLLLSLIVSILLVIYRWKHIHFKREWVYFLVCFCILFGMNSYWVISLPLSRYTPYSIFYSVKGYFENRKIIAKERPLFESNAVCHSDSLTVVFVLGESLNENHLQINGYKRQTTPYLMKEKNVVSFTHIYSEYGYTHESVPYILTRANHEQPDLGYSERSFISILNQVGYRTTWLANQESINTYTYFMNECDSLVYISNGKNLFLFGKWLDEDIIPHYKHILDLPYKRNFLLVHTVGSHWYYNNHYPDSFMRYKPVIKSKVITSNTHEEMVNAYDNTILYSDYIWHQLIEALRDRNAIFVYLADHSENMGENGHYAHGDGDWPAQHYPACFVWYSDKYQASYPDKIEAMKRNKDKNYNTSFLFHSILDASDIESSYINQTENIFR